MVNSRVAARLWYFCAAIGMALLSVASYRMMAPEYFAVLQDKQPLPTQIVTLSSTPIRPPLTVRAQRVSLEDCALVLRDPLGAFQPETVRQGLVSNCATLAQTLAAGAPTSSRAHLVLAAVAMERQDRPRLSREYLLSQVTGAEEGAVGQARIMIAAPAFDALDARAKAAFNADIRMLISTHSGRALVADQYRINPALRDVIISAAETAEPSDQRAFLAAIKRAGI